MYGKYSTTLFSYEHRSPKSTLKVTRLWSLWIHRASLSCPAHYWNIQIWQAKFGAYECTFGTNKRVIYVSA
jgi:hypothetical protein